MQYLLKRNVFMMGIFLVAPILVAQSGESAAAALPKREFIELDPEMYNDYVGVYEHNKVMHINVFVQNGKLYGQPTKKLKQELRPWDMDEFVVMGINGEMSFVRDGDGKVVSMVLHQDGRQEMAVRLPPKIDGDRKTGEQKTRKTEEKGTKKTGEPKKNESPKKLEKGKAGSKKDQ